MDPIWQWVAGASAGAALLGACAWAGSAAWRGARTVVTPTARRRPAIFETSWTLELQPGSVRLEARAGSFAWVALGFVVLVGWLVVGTPLVRPLLDRIGAVHDPRGAGALEHARARSGWEALAFVVAAVSVLGHALRRTEVILEALGDVRITERGLLGTLEREVPAAGFEALYVQSPGKVLVRWRPAPGEPLRHELVFETARKPELELWGDVNAASAAMYELARSRPGPPAAPA